MRAEWKPYTGSYGINWLICFLTVQPKDASGLRHIKYAQSAEANFRIERIVLKLYDRMAARDRGCSMRIAISAPIERAQAERLNVSKELVGNIAAGAFAGAAGAVHPALSIPAGFIGRKWVAGDLPVYHHKDILVAVEADVSGGIGPQRSAYSEIINADR